MKILIFTVNRQCHIVNYMRPSEDAI